MTGLEKILKSIEEDAKAAADKITSQAREQAEVILANAKAEAEQQASQIKEKALLDEKEAINRAESAAALQERRIILKAKQEMIQDIITKARNSLDELPDQEFSRMILQMAKRYAHNKKGSILLSTKDQKRLPQDFDQQLKLALAEKSGAELKVSAQTTDIDGGFLLVYGDIEENCSFDALFFAMKDTLQDKVNSMLFE